MGLFAKFRKYNLEDSVFTGFLDNFVKDLHTTEIDGVTWDTLMKDRHNKNTSVVNLRMNYLEKLMLMNIEIPEDSNDDFDNEELYSYLSTIPNVRYQIDNDDQSCLAIWLKESKVVKESNDLEEKDATDMLREIEEWYKNYSSSNAFYEDLSNIIDYNKLINWYKSL